MKNISVIIPVYNAENYVKKAVESALQFEEVKEVVLVEDASPDNALRICQQLEIENERVKLFRHPNGENKGAGASRNLGIEKATGEFIAFLDADDYYLPNRFEAEKELFKQSEVDGVYGALGVEYYSKKAKEQFYHLYEDRLMTVYKKTPPEDVFPGLLFLKGSFGLFSIDCLTLRKSSLQKLNGIYLNSALRLHQDSEFLIRCAYYLNLYPGILDKAIAVRGVHEENRITKVESKKVKPASTRVLLWESLDAWARKEETMPKSYQRHIAHMKRSFQIANSSFPVNYLKFIQSTFTHFPMVKSGLYNIHFREILFPFLKKFL